MALGTVLLQSFHDHLNYHPWNFSKALKNLNMLSSFKVAVSPLDLNLVIYISYESYSQKSI